jgi:hypothetical protein
VVCLPWTQHQILQSTNHILRSKLHQLVHHLS